MIMLTPQTQCCVFQIQSVRPINWLPLVNIEVDDCKQMTQFWERRTDQIVPIWRLQFCNGGQDLWVHFATMQIVIEGFYTKNCNEGPVIVKGHLVTQKIDIMKEKGLSLLQTEVGPQLKHLEIGEREGMVYVIVMWFIFEDSCRVSVLFCCMLLH